VPLPPSNLFVAGTSCKNFSMLRSTKKLDIEDMGCSGETFLAACELLFKEKPKYAIFENVDGAPWQKMSEYITGRIKLSTVAMKDKIKKTGGASKGKSGHLEFVRKDGNIVVDNVPAEYGVRCGATVSGYTKEGCSVTHEMKWPNKSKKSCTLDELIKHNGIDRKNSSLLLESDVVYCTKYVKVDTKKFGLPQTRQRKSSIEWHFSLTFTASNID
jgi:site-specific DNA-cytosine methylase